MGSVADKIAKKVASQIRANVIDLAEYRAGREFAHERGLDGSYFTQLVEEGYDPAFAFYTAGMSLVAMFAQAISVLPEGRAYNKAVAKAEDEYVPEGPPISPLTASYFNQWAFFDLQFGSSKETIGTCILTVSKAIGMPAWMADIVQPMQWSRMGFYLHVGFEGKFVLLKDIVSREVLRCHSSAGYAGERGQIWYVRLMPPPSLLVSYHVATTTPYVVLDGTEQKLLDYYARVLSRMPDIGRNKPADTDYLLKHGLCPNYWNEYVLLAYVNHQTDAVFLAGIPDILESLPQRDCARA
ncbi:MAG: hypothetical protein WCF85_20275 [Rhodospirillaceae bacterium]